jgi:hypothetical protein
MLPDVPPPTKFLSRLIGLYCIAISLSMLVHKQATVETLNAFIHDRPAMFLAGVAAFAAGLAMVLRHNVWSGGAAPVIVTLAGWVSLIKGVTLLFLPPLAQARFYDAFGIDRYFYLYMGFTLLAGAWLTWSGFRHVSQQ